MGRCKRVKKLISFVLIFFLALSNYGVKQVNAAGSKKVLSINWANIAAVGNQAPAKYEGGERISSQSCGCFSLAYSRTILDNRVHYWSEFDCYGGGDQYNCSADWPGAGFSNESFSSPQALYRACYDSINNNKPAIIHVEGPMAYWHYITIVGYDNVTDPNSLSASNFLFIDSIDGTTKSCLDNMGAAGYSPKNSPDDDGKGYHGHFIGSYSSDRCPEGFLESVSYVGNNSIRVKGWAYDPDKVDTSIQVHVYIGGALGDSNAEGHAVEANVYRDDIDNKYHIGGFHGFDATIKTNKTGLQPVYVYGIDLTQFGNNGMLNDSGKKVNIAGTIDKTPPTISNAKVTSITSTGYTVEVDITDSAGIEKVQFPSWPAYKSSEGCKWYSPTSVSGNHYTFKLSFNDFNKYSGVYNTHIYAWDKNGNSSSTAINKIGPLTMNPQYTAVSGNTKYEVYDYALRWTDAKAYAESKGGHLLTITSSSENDKFNKLLSDGKLKLSGKAAYWIGYTDEKSEGTFKWVTGETGSFTNFRSGEPNNANGNEDYVGIWKGDLKWNDVDDTFYVSANGDVGFIVEYDNNVCSHSWVKGNRINPSCTTKGSQQYKCSICGATKTEEIAATGHKPVTDAAVAATCTKDGKTAGSHCSVCGTVITAQQTVKATGHKWDSGKITKQPTTTSTGIRTYTCTKCGTIKTETVPKLQEEKKAGVTYTTHVQSIGWQSTVRNGDLAGTVGDGKRLEAIKINLENAPYSGGIEYRTHVQTYGWQGWVENGALSGTSGQAKRLEAIQIRLTGEMAKHYDVYYRIQVQSFGWLGWAKNGEYSGSAGYAKRLESIQIVLVEKGKTIDRTTLNKQANITSSTKVSDSTPYVAKAPSVEYQTHVQSIGWQGLKINGEMSGTSGMAKRLEGIKINLSKPPYEGGIRYKTHVQSYGWQGWSYDGSMSGTSGQSKRLEAIAIELTGEMAEHYDIYYRVHAQSYGWLGWAKNGQNAGTAGYAKRLEGIQIVLVEKGQAGPGVTYKGISANRTEAYISK